LVSQIWQPIPTQRIEVITFISTVETAKNNKLGGSQNIAIPEAATLF
jgi:hypothetical protein